MTRREWLADPQNQDDFYTLCRAVVVRAAPQEELLLQEIYPKYIELAIEGETASGAEPEQAFGFGDDAHLLILVLLPAAATFIGALLASQSLKRVAELRRLHKKKTAEELEQLVDKHLPQNLQDEALRRTLLEILFSPSDAENGLP